MEPLILSKRRDLQACLDASGQDSGFGSRVGKVRMSPILGSGTNVWVDVPWSPQEFVLQARRAGRPSHPLKQAIDRNARLSALELATIRASQSCRWLARATQPQNAERAFKESLLTSSRGSGQCQLGNPAAGETLIDCHKPVLLNDGCRTTR